MNIPSTHPDLDQASTAFRTGVGDDWSRLEARLRTVNADIATRGTLPHTIRDVTRELLTGYSYGEIYDWDLYFENLYLSWFGISRFTRANVEAFLDSQLGAGLIPRTLKFERRLQHFKPFLAQTAELHLRQTGSASWLAGDYFLRLEKYLDWWRWHLDLDRNSLSVWNSADHSGMDNQWRRAGNADEFSIEGADLNGYLVREYIAMSRLAAALDLPESVARYTALAKEVEQKIESLLWDETDGFYYDRNERTGEAVRVKTVAGLLPLWSFDIQPLRAERLVREHLLNPDEFWRPYPVASWAKSEPDYYQESRHGECNWMGPTWIPCNYMLAHGLARRGYRDEALDLAWRTFRLALQNETTREYYNAETGTGLGLDPFWGWSALAYLLPLEILADHDPTRLDGRPLLPLAELAGLGDTKPDHWR